MPWRKKRSWKRFIRKVNAVTHKSLGTVSVVFNDTILENLTQSFQGWTSCCLYGLRGKNGSPVVNTPNGYSDMFRIMNSDASIPTTGKIMLKSAVLDTTYTNTGTQPVELDLYEVWYQKDRHAYYDFDSAQSDAEAATPELPGALTLNMNSKGATLFDFPQTISNLGMKIMKKTKYFLSPAQSCTYQIRDARNHVLEKMPLIDDSYPNSFAWRKVSKGIIAIAKLTPSISETTGAITAGYTRKYSYTVLEQNGDAEAYQLP